MHHRKDAVKIRTVEKRHTNATKYKNSAPLLGKDADIVHCCKGKDAVSQTDWVR